MATTRHIEHVVFDWNGTLIDDLDLAVEAVNHVCRRFGVAPVTRQTYRANFRFPISTFYAALGFDLERIPFAEIVREYLSVFDAGVGDCPLHDGCVELLDFVRKRGMTLSILSASWRDTLVATIHTKQLTPYFTHVLGLEDSHATSKLAEAHALQTLLAAPPQRVLYVGDTSHDIDIGAAMGWTNWTVSCGHQDRERLVAQAPFVMDSLHAVRRSLAALTDDIGDHGAAAAGGGRA